MDLVHQRMGLVVVVGMAVIQDAMIMMIDHTEEAVEVSREAIVSR